LPCQNVEALLQCSSLQESDILRAPQWSAAWQKIFVAGIRPGMSIANMIPQWNGCLAKILAFPLVWKTKDTRTYKWVPFIMNILAISISWRRDRG